MELIIQASCHMTHAKGIQPDQKHSAVADPLPTWKKTKPIPNTLKIHILDS